MKKMKKKKKILAGLALLLSGVMLTTITPHLSSHAWDGKFFLLGWEEIWQSVLPLFFALFSYLGVGAGISLFIPLKKGFIKGGIILLIGGIGLWSLSGGLEGSLLGFFVATVCVALMLSLATACPSCTE
ncbi:MAG: hypothetical protein DLD55_04680 [candidate division SR1 bacterium]|nr:MAG: hypothetical protein DLD55_04680 [candidate division SR1 bacterium]